MERGTDNGQGGVSKVEKQAVCTFCSAHVLRFHSESESERESSQYHDLLFNALPICQSPFCSKHFKDFG